MSETVHHQHPLYFIHSLREYVISPVSTATRLIEKERSEITAELEAFREFRDRINTIDAVERTPPRYPGDRYERQKVGKKPIDRVRSAYRDTVMDTAHYEEVYDEQLVEHMAQELGPDVAEGLRIDTSVVFTPPYKMAIVTGATRAVASRKKFIETLDEEATSIETAKTTLTDVLAALDTTAVPEWHCEPFNERVTDIAQRRQNELREKSALPQLDEYSLYEYLYREEQWTFPVLTAIARLRESVDTN